MNCYLYKIPSSKETLHLLSPLNKDELAKLTSKSELFLGRLIDPDKEIIHGNISYNADFLVVLHRIVRDYMVTNEEVIEQAKKQPNGFVFIVDRRSNEEEVEKEDVIGIFLVNESQTDASRYRPNPDYKLISHKGPGMFHDEVEMELMKVLLEL
ncbi:MAG: hypothetical protein M3R17_02420 [Bacteroidota bacterium]|nr:hypothetical protein [Bacteroidota bacterium]